MQYAIKIERPDTCFKCESKRSIECYDIYNNPLNYSLLLDKLETRPDKTDETLSILNKRELVIMRCKKCNKQYVIKWNNGIPEPLRNFCFIEEFLDSNY